MPDAPPKPKPARKPRNDHGEPARHAGGRPHELDQVITLRDGHTTTVARAAIERMATGIPITKAAGALGIRRQTIHDWRRRGVRARNRQQAGEVITDPDDLRLIQFADECDEAEDRGFSTEWTRHGTLAAGGLERVTVTHRQVMGPDGPVTLTDRKVETLLPDAKAIQWRMAVRYGLAERNRLEVTGADGGPVELDVLDARAASLAERLRRMTDATVEASAVEVAPAAVVPTSAPPAPAPVRPRAPVSQRAELPSPDADVPPPPD